MKTDTEPAEIPRRSGPLRLRAGLGTGRAIREVLLRRSLGGVDARRFRGEGGRPRHERPLPAVLRRVRLAAGGLGLLSRRRWAPCGSESSRGTSVSRTRRSSARSSRRTASRATPTGARASRARSGSARSTRSAWSARYYGQNDRVSWEDDGRDVESDPTRVLRDALRGAGLVPPEQGPLVAQAGGLLRVRRRSTRRTAVRVLPKDRRRDRRHGDLRAARAPSRGLHAVGRALRAGGALPPRATTTGRPFLVGLRAEFPTVDVSLLLFGLAAITGRRPPSSSTCRASSGRRVKGLAATIEYSVRSMRTLSGTAVLKAFQLGLSVAF